MYFWNTKSDYGCFAQPKNVALNYQNKVLCID